MSTPTSFATSRRFARRAILNTVKDEQRGAAPGLLSMVLWDMFTGSAPYMDIIKRTLDPGFLLRLTRELASALWRTGGAAATTNDR